MEAISYTHFPYINMGTVGVHRVYHTQLCLLNVIFSVTVNMNIRLGNSVNLESFRETSG